MSKQLEDFIKNNREEFDDLEPRTDLWTAVEHRLPKQFEPERLGKKSFSLSFVLQVAAIIIMVMGACFAFYLHHEKPLTINLATINSEYASQQLHYTALIATKRTKLKLIAKSSPQLYNEFNVEIAKMDSTYRKLNHDLATSPNQELVLRAMIRNLQIQTEVLNQQLEVLEQYNELKNQKNENKSI